MEKISLLALFLMLMISLTETTTYKAAVVEFSPDVTTENFAVRAQNNLNGFESVLQSIQNDGVQIIVFPEDAISGFKDIIVDEEIPDPGANPCVDSGFESRPILKRLSCLALSYQVVLIANMGDKQEHNNVTNQYNTDVVFENDGKLIAKYYKINLFRYEIEMFTAGTVTQSSGVSFETNFGVKFGIFTCYDILFPQPSHFLIKSGIKNFVYPTAWGNKFPVYMSTALQQGWSSKNKVNLLAANLQITDNEENFFGTGSGLYSAGTARRYFMSGNIMTASTGKVLVAELPSEPADTTDQTQWGIVENTFNMLTTKTDGAAFKDLTSTNGSVTASIVRTEVELHCNLEYRIKSGSNNGQVQERYALGAYIRRNNLHAACFVVKCNSVSGCGHLIINGAETTFEYLRLDGSFPQGIQFPMAFSNGFELLPVAALQSANSGTEVFNSKIIAHILHFTRVCACNQSIDQSIKHGFDTCRGSQPKWAYETLQKQQQSDYHVCNTTSSCSQRSTSREPALTDNDSPMSTIALSFLEKLCQFTISNKRVFMFLFRILLRFIWRPFPFTKFLISCTVSGVLYISSVTMCVMQNANTC